MALLARATTPDAQGLAIDEPFDVMALRRLTDHPKLKPLTAHRHILVKRLQGLQEDHRRLEAERETLQQTEAQAVITLGGSWTPVKFREIKEQLSDNEAEASTLTAALELLDLQMEETKTLVRDELEVAFNRLRKPLLQQVLTALESIVEANKSIHAIEGLSQALLGVAKYHLYDASLPHRLQVMTRTAHLLDLAALGSDAD